MPKIPDETALSGVTPRAVTPALSIPATDPALTAVQGFGKAFSSAAYSLGQLFEKDATGNDQIEVARATSGLAADGIRLRGEFDNDQDYGTLQPRFMEKYTRQLQDRAQSITNPRARELFLARTQNDVAREEEWARRETFTRERNYSLANLQARLTEGQKLFAVARDDAERERLVDGYRAEIDGAVKKGWMSPIDAEKVRTDWAKGAAIDYVTSLPPPERLTALRGAREAQIDRTPVGAIIDREAQASGIDPVLLKRYASIESSGNPFAKTGSYKGLFQLSDEEFSRHGGQGDIYDPVQNTRAAIGSLKARIETFRSRFGRDPSATELYLSHQQGDAGLAAHLANPDQPAWMNMASTGEGRQKGESWAKQAIWGNVPEDVRSRYPGGVESLSSREFVDIWRRKVEGSSPHAKFVSFIPEDKRMSLEEQTAKEITTQAARASADRAEVYERGIIDASAGRGDLPRRESIEGDITLDDRHRNTLLRQYDAAAGEVVAFQNAFTRFKDGSPFNPYEKEERKQVDKIFGVLGGDDAALTAVIQRTGILPGSAASKMRADLISNNPERVKVAMTRAANAIGMNQNIMTGFDGANELEKNAVKFRALVDDFGMTADEAAQRMIREQAPEFKSAVNAKIKSEDVDDKIKKSLTVNDLASSFDESFLGLARNPKVGASVRARDAMYDQYASLVKEHYLDTASGDFDMAKKIAAAQLRKTWGVSAVTGTNVLMQYPPERAPAYHGIEKVSEAVSAQAVAAIKDEAGIDVPRDAIRIIPIPGTTAQAYKAGQPPPYTLMWQDKNGVMQMLKPGRAFVADPAEMRAAQSAERERLLTEQRNATDVNRMIGDDPRRPFGVQ